jgi:glucose-1-phosphate adenylyltransferase
MSNLAAFVLAGGRVMETGVLTHRRAKAAVPFAGHYRIIDFAMSNLARSGIERVGVLSQYRPSSLMDHVATGEPWGLIGRGREVRILSPFQAVNSVEWYQGTADAVYQNLSFLNGEDHVLIVAGDHIYQMDYRALLRRHVDSGADATMVFKRFPESHCRRFGNGVLGPDGWVKQYVEKPETPLSDLGSLTIYVFRRAVLEEQLRKLFSSPPRHFHIYETVLPELVRQGRVQGFVFDDYWSYARTVDDYYEASMDLVDPDSGLLLDQWEVHTNPEQSGIGVTPPAMVGRGAEVEASRLSPGVTVDGRVVNSTLSPGVVVEAGAEVVDSILLHGVRVSAGALVTKAIVDKHVTIGPGAVVGHLEAAVASCSLPEFQRCGVTVIGRDAVVGSRCKVGANCQVAPEYVLEPGTIIPDGASRGGVTC